MGRSRFVGGVFAGLLVLAGVSVLPVSDGLAQGQIPRARRAQRSIDAVRVRLAQARVTKYCTYLRPDLFHCKRVSDLLGELPLTGDAKVLAQAGLEDMADLAGRGGTGADTLVNCMGVARAMDRKNFVTVTTESSFASAGALRGVASLPNRKAPSISDLQTPMGRDVGKMEGACGQRARDEATGALTNPGGGSQDYQRAVQNAVQAMDAAVAGCRESGNGMISNPGSGGASTPPATTGSGGTAPAGPAPTATGTTAPTSTGTGTGAPPPATDPETEKLKAATMTFVNWVSGFTSMAATDLKAIEGELGAAAGKGSAGGKAAIASLLLNIVGKVLFNAGFVSEADHATFAAWVSTSSDVVQVAGFVADAIGVFAGGGAAGGAGAAAGAAVGLPEVAMALGAGLAIYSAYSLSDKYVAPNVGGRLGEFWGDAMWNLQYGQAGGGAGRPNPEGGHSCADARARWDRFKTYCSQSGNNWRTYDCSRFVAFLNGCPDPALINPGPNGDYECRGRRSEADKRKAACEVHRKLRDMFSSRASSATIVDSDRHVRQSCSGLAAARPSSIDCRRINPGESSLCGNAPGNPTAPSGGGRPALPGPGRPGMPTPR